MEAKNDCFSKEKRKRRNLNSLTAPKYMEWKTPWDFWLFGLLQKIKKLEEGNNAKKMLEKSWQKQGLEPVTPGLTINRMKTVLTSTRERVKSVKSVKSVKV